jgi:competence protein ComEC
VANPGEFDFAWYCRANRQIFGLRSRFPDAVTVASRGSSLSARHVLGALRDRANALLHRHLDHPEVELAAAVLLGAREQLTHDKTEAFFTTGTIHLLAISGLHVGILAFGFWWATRLFGMRRRTALMAVMAFVVVYALLTDARPPVVRAAVLISAFCVARLSGRRSFTSNTLAAAALLLLAVNPINLFQVGTQLSFLAVAAITFFAPLFLKPRTEDPLDRLIAQTRPWPVRLWHRFMRYGGTICVISWLIWLVALPLVMYHFHLVSPIALLLNPIVWLPVAVALFCGFGVLIFGWILPPLGDLFGFACNASLETLEGVVRYAHGIEGSHFWVPGPAAWWVVGFYLGLAIYVAFLRYRLPRRWCVAVLAAWIAIGACSPWGKDRLARSDDDSQFACTFLSIGHGACTVLELPGQQTVLCDAGCVQSSRGVAETISTFLWSRDITHVDAVVLSHADSDHYNALPELLERFSIGVVYVSPVMFDEESKALAVLREAVQDAGVSIREIHAGDRLDVQEATRIEVLHPPRRGIIGSDNANSIVLRIDYDDKRILLPGDLESPGLDDVLAEEPVGFDVVLTPHHGSMSNNPREVAAWARPDWAITSGGPGDRDRATAAAYEDVGAQVLHTATEGAVRVVIRNGEIEVRTWRRQPWCD